MEIPNEQHDYFLAEWLAGRISDAELKGLVSDADFHAFEKLRNSLDKMKIAGPDVASSYASVKRKMIQHHDRRERKVLPLYKYAAAAAIILMFVGLYQFFIYSNVNDTGIADSRLIALTDGSKIIISSKSSVAYPNLFHLNRSIKLDGQAYFEVEKGSKFCVSTDQGSIEVLGTKFNVVSHAGYFEVICYEGKVLVTAENKSAYLTEGMAIRFSGGNIERWTDKAISPSWIAGESTFHNTDIKQVLAQLERQYGYKVQYPPSLDQVKFTGSFTHTNIETALKSVCIPINAEYEILSGKIIISE